MSMLNIFDLSSSLSNPWNRVILTILMSLPTNSNICISSGSVWLFTFLNIGHIFVCPVFFINAIHCEFALWRARYFCSSTFLSLFWGQLFGNSLILSSMTFFPLPKSYIWMFDFDIKSSVSIFSSDMSFLVWEILLYLSVTKSAIFSCKHFYNFSFYV